MPRTLTIHSALPPQNILQSLERASTAWRASHHASRLSPPNTDGIRVSLRAPQFKLAYNKTTREWTHPVCVGSVASEGSGSTITATIRTSRELLGPLLVMLVLFLVSWIRGDLTIGPMVMMIAMLGILVLIGALTVLFSSSDPEAEADALRAILQSAANGELA